MDLKEIGWIGIDQFKQVLVADSYIVVVIALRLTVILRIKNFSSTGCGCQYSAYGCCPDNATVARGPDAEGCGCQYTKFGCCPNRYTPAAGPEFQGCPCFTYQFGCCPDGVNIARGPHNQGMSKF